MGFTALLFIAYIVFVSLTVLAFIEKKKMIGILLLGVIVISTVILGYLWITSPM